MSSKRIHKTLEEVKAENEFEAMHSELAGNHTPYDETAQATDLPPEEYAQWDEEDPQGSFEALTDVAEPAAAFQSQDQETEFKTSTRPRGRKPKWRTGPTPAIFAGTMITLGGFALAAIAILAPGAGGPLAANLNAAGLTPGVILTLGIMILMVIAIVRRQQRTIQQQITWVMSNQDTNSEILDYMIEIERRVGAQRQAPGGAEEVQQMLHAIMRQDEKINNITKALKMYGKPLVDVNRTATENGQKTMMVASQLGELMERLEQMSQGPDLSGALSDTMGELASKFDRVGDQLREALVETLRQISREGTEEMMKAVEIFSEQVTSDVSRVVSSMPKEDSTTNSLQALQRDLAALSDSMARLQSAPVTAAPAAAPQVRSAPTPQAAPEPAPNSPQQSAPPPGEGHAASISGTETTSGKNVLGAIAKLRKMR